MTFGISAALLTPFAADGSIDAERLAAHAADLLGRGLAGVTPFGTTGEGASVGAAERRAALDAFVAAGLPMARVTLGLAARALDDALQQARAAHERGVGAVLVTSQFYYPGPDDVAVHDRYAALLARLPEGLGVVLYHIPRVTGVAPSPGTVARLHGTYPERVRAIQGQLRRPGRRARLPRPRRAGGADRRRAAARPARRRRCRRGDLGHGEPPPGAAPAGGRRGARTPRSTRASTRSSRTR